MKTPLLIATAVVSFGLLSNAAYSEDCSKDQAYEMYAKINDHAAALKSDAQANPSKIPFQSGKNDPRLKKSVKITDQTAAINKDHLKTKQFNEACTKLAKVAKTYKINVSGQAATGENVKKGLKVAGQVNSLRNAVK